MALGPHIFKIKLYTKNNQTFFFIRHSCGYLYINNVFDNGKNIFKHNIELFFLRHGRFCCVKIYLQWRLQYDFIISLL